MYKAWFDNVRALVDEVEPVLREKGFQRLGEGDRHGSYEWAWGRENDLKRWIALSLTAAEEEGAGVLELWVGAQRDRRYTARRVALLEVASPMHAWQVREEVLETALRCVQEAYGLTSSDLQDIAPLRWGSTPTEELDFLGPPPQGTGK